MRAINFLINSKSDINTYFYHFSLIIHKYGSLIPPSNLQVSPVAYGFLIILSTASANYDELPSLPIGVLLIITSRYFLLIPLPIGVSKIPGAIVITLILYLPRSRAIGRVMPIRAPLEAEYTT